MEGDFVDTDTDACVGVIDCGEFLVQPFNYVDCLDGTEALNPSINIFFEVLSKAHKQLLGSRIYELMNMGVETPTGRFEFTNVFLSTQGSLVKYLCSGKLQRPQFQGMPPYYYCDSIFEICPSSGIVEEHLIPYKSYILGDREVHVHVKPKDDEDEGEMLLDFQQYSEVRMTLKDEAFLDQEGEDVSSPDFFFNDQEQDEIEAALAAMGFHEVKQDQTPQAE